MKTVYDALDPIVKGSATEKEKGTKYEAACVFFLKSDPFWSKFLSRVGTLEQARAWDDCPVRDPVDPGRTVKMKFGKCKKSEENPKGQDMTVLHVSENMTLRNIPLEAYDYVVNGRSAIGWLMDRYQVKKDKASGIVNDPNDYSDDPRYIVNLVERVVTVSVRTMEIVRQLPALNEKDRTANWPTAWKVDQGK